MTKKPRNWSKGKYRTIVLQIDKKMRAGHAYEAIRFVHFSCTPQSFMSQLYALAKDYNVKVSCASTSTRVIYRFYHPKSPWRPNMQAFAVVIRAKRDEELGRTE